MNIVKQSTGNVVLTDAAGNIQKVFVNVNALDVKGTDEVIVKFGFNQWHTLFASEVKTTQVEPAAAVTFSGNAFDLVALLSSSFFFELSGGGGGDDLATVLIAGNSAGANDINLNGNDLLNVDTITSTGDLFLNPVGSVDLNGKTLNMTGGEIHNVPLIHSLNNTDLTIEGKGTGEVVMKTNNLQRLIFTDTGSIDFYQDANLNGQNITKLINVSGKTNTDLTVEALGTGDIVFKTNNVDRLKITDAGVFTGLPEAIQLAASDETTALTTGTAKVTFRIPFAMTLTGVRASLTTAQTSGSIFTVDINQGGTSVLGTKLTIDNTEKTSTTAATAATITTSALTDDAEITVDIDQIGDGTAKGLKITLIGTRS